jgi:hypothetical protein
LPVVQGGITEQVSVANLTAGRDVSASGLFVDANSATAAVRITQLGAGDALVVEDSTNPDSTPFVINASGGVVIGSTAQITGSGFTPKVQLLGTSNALTSVGQYAFSASASSPIAEYALSRSGTIGTQTIVQDGDTVGSIRFSGSDGTGFIRAAQIVTQVDGTPGTNDMPGRLVFSTTADGASSPTERLRIASDGLTSLQNSSGLSIARTAVTSPATTDGNVFSGTWTPTITNGINTASSTAFECLYMRVGSQITFAGQVAITPTLSATETRLTMSLPVASNFTVGRDAGGTFWSSTSATQNQGGVILAESTADVLQFRLTPASITASTYYFSGSYRVK